MHQIIVTTTDLKRDYETIGPIYFHISNKGFFTSRLSQLLDKYEKELKEVEQQREKGEAQDWDLQYGLHSYETDSRFEKAFYVAIRELKEIARKMNADAIIGMRQDVRLDPNAHQYFYLQLYGTAVRYTNTI